MSTTNESIWNDIRRRGNGSDIKKEDNVNNMGIDDFVDYLVANYRDKVYSMDKDHFCKEYEMDIVVDPIKDIVIYGSYVNDELSRIMVVLRNRGQIRLEDWIGKIIENSPDNFRWICMYSDKYELKLKEGDVTNQTYVDLIEFFLNNITLFESVWGDIRRQGNGSDIKKEDNVNLLDVDGLYEYVKSHYTGKVFYIDKDNFGSKHEKVCVDPVKNVSLYTKYDNNNGELDHILISWISVHLDKDFIWKIYDRFQVEKTNPYRLCVWNQDGTCTNQTYIDLIDLFVENKDNVVVNESVWNDIRKRGNGSEIKKEDEIPQELQKPLAIYIEMFASNAFKGDYTVDSYPDFRAFVKDFMNSPRIMKLDFDMGDLLDYLTQDNYYDVIHPVIMDTIQKINNEIDVAVNNIIDNLKDSNVNESVWNDIRRRGVGDSVKQEEFTEEFIDKVKSDLIGFTMSVVYYIENYELTFDGFYKYLEEIENPDEIKKIIYYVKTHKDECDKLLEKDIKFENKLLDEKVNVYLLRFVDNIVYDEKYHNTLSDIKKFASEIFKGHKSSYDFHINKKLVFKDKSELFNDYIEDKWKDGSLKQKIDDLIKNENDKISKYGFKKEPGKTIADTVNDWWDSLDGSKRDELAWDEFGEDAEEEYYTNHNPKYNDYDGEGFYADEWWDDSYYIRRVHIYCQEHSKKNESVWNDIRRRGNGEEVKKEDEVLTDMEINSLNEFTLMYCRKERAHYIQHHIVPPPPSRRKENDYEGLIKYIEDRRDENLFTNVGDYDKIIKYIKKNWDRLDMDTYIKKWICSPSVMKGTKIVECDGVPGGATPANVGGMGAAYFPGPNGEPGSGDLPSPTGIVYHQVAPFGVFIKELKKKKKKKKFRKEDEPCSHSPNAKVYDYVDDYREYVDRTYTMMNKKK